MDRKIVVAVILLIVLGIVVTKSSMRSSLFSSPSASTVTAQDISIVSNSIKQNANNITISMVYPQILSDSNNSAQNAINTDIQKFVNSNITFMQTQINDYNTGSPSKNPASQINGVYTTGQQGKTVVSVHFTFFYNTQFLAHPITYNKTLVYNLNSGKRITTGGLFKSNSNYVQVLSNYVQKDLAKKFEQNPNSSAFITEGLSNPKNLQNIIVSDNSVIIFFDPATIAPDYVGTVEVAIPFSSIQSILNPQLLQ